MTGAKYLTRLDLSLTHSDSRRTASDRPRILFFTECDKPPPTPLPRIHVDTTTCSPKGILHVSALFRGSMIFDRFYSKIKGASISRYSASIIFTELFFERCWYLRVLAVPEHLIEWRRSYVEFSKICEQKFVRSNEVGRNARGARQQKGKQLGLTVEF